VSQMLPQMLEKTWLAVNSNQWYDGGWLIGNVHRLLVVDMQGEDRACWVLRDKDPPGPLPSPTYFLMTPYEWEKVSGGRLDPETGIITKNNLSYKIWAVVNQEGDGTAQARRLRSQK
jgi:hypothetical protein